MSADLYLYTFPADAPSRTWTDIDDDYGATNYRQWGPLHRAAWARLDDASTGNVWIGQIGGWGNNPAATANAQRVARDCPILTPGLLAAIIVGFNRPHTSSYERPEYRQILPPDGRIGAPRRGRHYEALRSRGVAAPRTVKRALAAHVGERIVPLTL